jgi:hypothetical protein
MIGRRLTKDHHATDCRDTMKCVLCFGSGHRARHCHSSTCDKASTTTSPQLQQPPATIAKLVRPTHPTPPAMTSHHFLLRDSAMPGLPTQRLDKAEVVVKYTAELVAVENDYHSRGVTDILICDDPWFHVSWDAVRKAIRAWLSVPRRDIEVEFYSAKGFLVLLPMPAIRDRALSLSVRFTIGQVKLHLMP